MEWKQTILSPICRKPQQLSMSTSSMFASSQSKEQNGMNEMTPTAQKEKASSLEDIIFPGDLNSGNIYSVTRLFSLLVRRRVKATVLC